MKPVSQKGSKVAQIIIRSENLQVRSIIINTTKYSTPKNLEYIVLTAITEVMHAEQNLAREEVSNEIQRPTQ